jgi:hypothetical protein
MRNIYHQGGFRGFFFIGNYVNIAKVGPETALKFLPFDELAQHVSGNGDVTPFQRLTAGALAGACAQTAIIYSLEVVKTKMILDPSKSNSSSIVGTPTHTVRTAGYRELYLGLAPSLVGIAPYEGVDLALFTFLRDRYCAKKGHDRPGALTLLFLWYEQQQCGNVDHMSASADQNTHAGTDCRKTQEGAEKFKSLADCARKILHQGGVRGFYKGLLSNFPRGVPAISISYTLLGTTKQALHKQNC